MNLTAILPDDTVKSSIRISLIFNICARNIRNWTEKAWTSDTELISPANKNDKIMGQVRLPSTGTVHRPTEVVGDVEILADVAAITVVETLAELVDVIVVEMRAEVVVAIVVVTLAKVVVAIVVVSLAKVVVAIVVVTLVVVMIEEVRDEVDVLVVTVVVTVVVIVVVGRVVKVLVGRTTVMVPNMSSGWMAQKYGKAPTSLNTLL